MASNPFAFPDATSYYISANKSLADIDNTKAETDYRKAATAKTLADVDKLKAEAAEKEAIKRAAAEDAGKANASPFTTSNDPTMPGTSADGGSNLTILGQAPMFPKLYAAANEADAKYRRFASISPDYAKQYLKQRDELLGKASDDQRQWVENMGKNINRVNEMLGGITGAPTYNATMRDLVAEQGPGVLKKLGLPATISQQEYETNPEFADRIQAIRQRGYSLKDELHQKLEESKAAQQKAHQEAQEEDARLRRAEEAKRTAIQRDDLKLRRETAAEEKRKQEEARVERRADSLIEHARDNLAKSEAVKDFPKFQQGAKTVDKMLEAVVDPTTGDFPENWWRNIGIPQQQVIAQTFKDMKGQFKERAGTVLDAKQYAEADGLFQGIAKYAQTVGTGKAPVGEESTLQALKAIKTMADVNNAYVAKQELKELSSLVKSGVDLRGRVSLTADYNQLIKSGIASVVVKDNKAATDEHGNVLLQFNEGGKKVYFAVPKGAL